MDHLEASLRHLMTISRELGQKIIPSIGFRSVGRLRSALSYRSQNRGSSWLLAVGDPLRD